jgi:5-methylcytosine-specific restriction endonuclease McrA
MTPSEARSIPYEQYLQTEHWQAMRRLALEAADHHCLLCDADSNLDVHHRTYERLGMEQLRDLVVLCETCHARHHEVFERAALTAAESERIAFLEAEILAEMAGAQFLAAQVERAWVDGVEEGRRRGKTEGVA